MVEIFPSSWSSGAVSGVSYVGGLIGRIAGRRVDYAGGGAIASSWSSGAVSGERNVGGLVGIDGNGDSTTVSYWSVETSARDIPIAGSGLTHCKRSALRLGMRMLGALGVIRIFRFWSRLTRICKRRG